MNRWLNLLKTEMDVEFFSAVHWVAVAWCYVLIRFIFQKDGIGFWTFTEMGLVAYIMGWSQKILYVNEKIYTRIHGVMRRFCWIAIPLILLILSQFLFGWFSIQEWQEVLLFDTVLLLFYILLEFLIYYVYKEDTKVLNELLKEYQENEIKEKQSKESDKL